MRGGYAGHGETYADPDDLIWWAKGGKLHGEAWKRIGFLREIIEEDAEGRAHADGLQRRMAVEPHLRAPTRRQGDLSSTSASTSPTSGPPGLPKDDGNYEVDLIDTWNMTVTPAKRIPAHVPHPTRHGDVVRGGKADAAFGVAR